MSDCFNKIYVSDIPENVSTLEDLKIKLNNTNILNFKRVGIKDTKPRKLLITMDSYQAIIKKKLEVMIKGSEMVGRRTKSWHNTLLEVI